VKNSAPFLVQDLSRTAQSAHPIYSSHLFCMIVRYMGRDASLYCVW